MERYKKFANQLGKKIPEPGAHMPSAAVGILRRMRTRQDDLKEKIKGGSKIKPIKENDPFPMEFLPGSM